MSSDSLFLCLALFVSACNPRLLAQQVLAQQSSVESRMEHIPLVFEPNRGQATGDLSFLSRGNEYTLLLGSDKSVFVFSPTADIGDHGKRRQPAVVTVELLHSNKGVRPEGLDLLPGKSNYFIGKQPANWIAGIPQYGRVGVNSIYPGMDLVYYGNGGQLEYDFVLSPGADPRALIFVLPGPIGLI
jgi:hypothetical protein